MSSEVILKKMTKVAKMFTKVLEILIRDAYTEQK